MNGIYLLLGSNLDDRHENLDRARDLINQRAGKIAATSGIYETAAWGIEDQEPFLNQAIEIRSDLTPEYLLRELKSIEQDIGREQTLRWGPRLIDIDILLMGNLVFKSDNLSIPHKAIAKRRFTLVPLTEIAADLVHPVEGITIKEMLERCTDTLAVTKQKPINEV